MFALLLAALATLGPFAVDTYLPAFQNIQESLNATPLEVQQTLTVYMLAFSVMMLWHGALADAFGRRNIVLGSMAVFAVATLGCAASHSVHYLWAFRMLQGISAGAGVVASRAIVRDVYAGPAAAQLVSLVMMIFSIAPAIAPILGGWIVKYFDWRAIFLSLFVYVIVLLCVSYKYLPETLPPERRVPFKPHFLWHNYMLMFRSSRLQLKAGVMAFNFAGMFLYIAASPVFVTQHLQLGIDQFGWQYVPSVAGIFFGALASNRLAGKIAIHAQVRLGFFFLIGAALVNLTYHAFFPPGVPWSVIPLFFYTFGIAIVSPGVTLLMLDLFPHIRGYVASYQSFSVMALAAVISGGVAPALSHSTLLLAAGQLAFTLAGLLCWLIVSQKK